RVFSAAGGVLVGAGVAVHAYNLSIRCLRDCFGLSMPLRRQLRRSQWVAIGDGAWPGAGAKILDGASVGEDAVIGAGAVVRESIPASAIAVGVPARVVASRNARTP